MSKQSDKPNEGVKNLAEIRKIAGITQKELAHLSGVAHITVRLVETGRKQYSEQLVEKLARGLGCGIRFSRGSEAPELIKTRLQSDEEYTTEWFEQWKLVCERKRVYSRFLLQYAGLLSDIVGAACELDLEEEEGGEASAPCFIRADQVTEQFLEVLMTVMPDSGLAEKLLVIANRESPEEHFVDSEDLIRHRLDNLREAIDLKKCSHVKKCESTDK